MFRVRHDGTGPRSRFVVARSVLLVAGGGLGLLGMMLQARTVVWIGIVVLVVAFLLRFVPVSHVEEHDDTDHTEDL